MLDDDEDRRRVVEGRSPSFPFIPLAKAMEQARKLERTCRAHAVRVGTAIEAFGFKADSSGGRQTVSALKAFGLLTDTGSGTDRKVQLTDFARKLLLNPPPELERELIREAALNPKLLQAMRQRWGAERPPNSDCLHQLRTEMRFTEGAAATFLNVYDATMAFAGLDKSDSLPERAEAREGNFTDVPSQTGEATKGSSDKGGALIHPPAEVGIMDGERVVFVQEVDPDHHVRLVVKGEVDQELIDALESYIEAQKKKLERRRKEQERAIAPTFFEPQQPGQASVVTN